MTTKRLGILGGTFDPIHLGHLAIAEDVRFALDLERVLLIPAAHQPLKHQAGATAAQRLTMVELACASNPSFEPSAIEINRPGLSYTVTTLEQIRTQYTGEIYFILGTDALRDLPRWRNVERLLELTRIAAVVRAGVATNPDASMRALPALAKRLVLIDGPRLDIASTDIRQRVRTGRSIRYLVPESVADYIAAQHLYRDAQ